jgi:hypothetical protein
MRRDFLFEWDRRLAFLATLAVITVAQIALTLGAVELVCRFYGGSQALYCVVPAASTVGAMAFGALLPRFAWLSASLGQTLAVVVWSSLIWRLGQKIPFTPEVHLTPLFAALGAGATGILFLPTRWRAVPGSKVAAAANPAYGPAAAESTWVELVGLVDGVRPSARSRAVWVRVTEIRERSVVWEVWERILCSGGVQCSARVRLRGSRPESARVRDVFADLAGLASLGLRECEARINRTVQAITGANPGFSMTSPSTEEGGENGPAGPP